MRDILRTLEEQVQPEHTALIIVDMQNDFCATDGFLQRVRAAKVGYDVDESANIAIADNIGALASAARKAGAKVVWLRSLYDFKYLADAHIAKRVDEGCCMEGTWGTEFFRIEPQEGDQVLTKHTFSGFYETGLHEALQEAGIKTIIVTGVATNVCVDSTLREGFFRGYYIVVPEDCVGSTNQAGHEGTLSTVRVNFGSVVDSTELIHRFEASPVLLR